MQTFTIAGRSVNDIAAFKSHQYYNKCFICTIPLVANTPCVDFQLITAERKLYNEDLLVINM